ncbi:MAG TPA: hypothetical protein VI583_09470 [Cyclobacteriaceae bacterium]|nr:hypothetical protein [Cyclobacteriaceae bacterium]
MKSINPVTTLFFGFLFLVILFTACTKIEGPGYTNEQTQYALNPASEIGMEGSITFTKRSDNSVIVTVQLKGTAEGCSHPTYIHANNSLEGGPAVLELNAVDGGTGVSETIVTSFSDETPLTYESLVSFIGHVKVHVSPGNLVDIIALGDIGPQ